MKLWNMWSAFFVVMFVPMMLCALFVAGCSNNRVTDQDFVGADTEVKLISEFDGVKLYRVKQTKPYVHFWYIVKTENGVALR